MFSKRLQTVRKRLQLSQEEISTQIVISYRSYSSYERCEREPNIVFLETLVTKFNINLNWLIAGVGEMFNAAQFDTDKEHLRQLMLQILKEEGIKK